jgi:hypothetical protein
LTFITVWYSTVLTCLTVYQLVAEKDFVRDTTSAALAVILLALSLFLPSLNLEQQADRYRECYLKLQALLDTIRDDKNLTKAYYEVLQAFPNHPPSDYGDFIVSAKMTGQEVSSGGRQIKPTCMMQVGFWFRRFVAAALFSLSLAAPGLIYFIL